MSCDWYLLSIRGRRRFPVAAVVRRPFLTLGLTAAEFEYREHDANEHHREHEDGDSKQHWITHLRSPRAARAANLK